MLNNLWRKLTLPQGILPDWEIRRLSDDPHWMIHPFSEKKRSHGTSVGVSSFGYDIALGKNWLVPESSSDCIVNDLSTGEQVRYEKITSYSFALLPGKFVLAETKEMFHIPKDILTVCQGKSSIARLGISILVTPFEPGWSGVATLEISNHSSNLVRLHTGQGIAQLLFFRGLQPERSYAGKYQNQTCVQAAIRDIDNV